MSQVTLQISHRLASCQHLAGESGYLVSPGDVNAISERLNSLLSNQTKAKMMGQAGRVMAEKHSNERSQQAHEQLYESLAVPA